MLYANQKYDRRMSSEQRGLRKLNILHVAEVIVLMVLEQLKDQYSQEWLRELLSKPTVASRVP